MYLSVARPLFLRRMINGYLEYVHLTKDQAILCTRGVVGQSLKYRSKDEVLINVNEVEEEVFK